MGRKTRWKPWISGALAIIVLSGILAWTLATRDTPADPTDVATSPESQTPASILAEALALVEAQKTVDADLLKELSGGAYTLEDPLVVVDPYDRSPLTALVVYRTAVPTRTTLHVAGKDELSSLDFAFDAYSTDHFVPVYGLYADQVNEVVLSAVDEKGAITRKTLSIETSPVSPVLANLLIQTDLTDAERYQPGFNFAYCFNGMKAAYDVHGDFRWFLKDPYNFPTCYDFNGHFLVVKGADAQGDVFLYEIDPLGRIYRLLHSPYGLHHAVEPYSNDRLLLTGSLGETIEDLVYELDASTGAVVNQVDLKTILQRSRPGLGLVGTPDWFHLNAIAPVPGSGDLLVSGRFQSAVVRFAWPSGTVDWILAPPQGWSMMFRKYLLDPIGNGFEWSYNQHAPEILPDQDGNPDTLDILLFDNGNQRFVLDAELQRRIRNNEIVPPERYSRLVQYRIDEKNRTIEQIWEYGKEEGETLYADARGNVNLLANGTILGLFATGSESVAYHAITVEVDREDGVVWQAMAASRDATGRLEEYRTTRMEIYNASANELQIGTPVLDLIPQEVLDRYGLHE
jgi:arylsulfate sulfotransferase